MKIFNWILFFCILLFFGIVYFFASFSLFEEPQKVKLFDLSYQNQKYEVVSVSGNAVTNYSVQLYSDETQHAFLITRSCFQKGYQTKLNDSIFQCIFIDGRNTKDTVLLNMETKKMGYYSE